MRPHHNTRNFFEGIRSGDRVVLSQAITLIESTNESDRLLREELIDKVLPFTGQSIRIGITGVPGVGKSTFIESFGNHITSSGKNLAVLTVDPTSTLTKGSILGDKTRMNTLSKNERAYIRPSASGLHPGGLAARTRETMLLCEAAGFDVVIIETVGVGQSEIQVRHLVDFFMLLLLPGAGDELQGMKKGIIEMADALVITKADGDNLVKAQKAGSDYQQALHLLSPQEGWAPQVRICSAIAGTGVVEVWDMIETFERESTANGTLQRQRQEQKITWLKDYFQSLLDNELHRDATLRQTFETLESAVKKNEISITKAARMMLDAYHVAIRGDKGKLR